MLESIFTLRIQKTKGSLLEMALGLWKIYMSGKKKLLTTLTFKWLFKFYFLLMEHTQ